MSAESRLQAVFAAAAVLSCLLAAGCGGGESASAEEKALIEDLQDGRVEERLAAAERLGELRSKAGVKALIRVLEHDVRPDVRLAATVALGLIAEARATDALCGALKASTWQQRQAAARSLGQIRDSKAIKPLATALTDKHGAVASMAAQALGEMGRGAEAAAVEAAAVEKLKHENQRVRELAVSVLGQIKGSGAAEVIRGRLGDSAPLVRLAAAEALAQRGDAESAERIVRMLKDEDPSVRKGVVRPLIRLGKAAIRYVAPAVEDRDRSVRAASVAILGKIGDPEATGALLTAAAGRDSRTAKSAKEFLSKLAQAGRITGRLIKALGHDQPSVRRAAIELLEPLTEDVPFDVAAKALTDRDPGVRAVAVRMLRRIDLKKAVASLAKVLEDDDPNVRVGAAEALAAAGDKRAVNVLLAYLKSSLPVASKARKSELARVEAALNALGQIRDLRAVDVLIALLKSENPRVAALAARALGRIGDRRAVPHLIPLITVKEKKDLSNGRGRDSRMQTACRALGLLRDKRAFKPLIALTASAEHRYWAPILESAVDAMVAIDPEGSIQPILDMLERAEPFDHEKIKHLPKVLAEMATPRAVGAIARYMLADIPYVREAAAGHLRDMCLKEPKCIDALIAQMHGQGAPLRSAAAGVLSEVGRPAFKPLLEALKSGQPQVRHGAAWALGTMKDTEAVEPLTAALGDANEHVRAAAAWGLGRHKDTRAIDPLIKLLADEHPKPRLGAIEALSRIGDTRAVAPLTAAMKKEQVASLRAAIVEALGRLGDLKGIESPVTTRPAGPARQPGK